ncbi:MAG: Ig-like domain-containing protein, partial [Bryobacteraceae bacterium]
PTPVNAGTSPIDVAVSMDSTRAFVLSASDQKLVAVDLATYSRVGEVSIPGQSTGVAVGPNSMVYVTTLNRIYEIDPRTMTLTLPDGIALNGRPSKLVFTPDGRYGVATNLTPVAGNSSVLLFDLLNKTVASSIPNFGVVLDRIFMAGANRAFALSSDTRRVYEVTINPLNVGVPSFGGIGEITNVIAGGVSNELPQPRFLYLLAPTTIYRIELASYQLSGQVGVTTTPSRLSIATPASTNAPTSLLLYNNNQTLAPLATSLPLIVRALDSFGRPVLGATVAWSTAQAGAVIQPVGNATNGEGYALATVTAPSTAGTFTVTATVAGSLVATFTINVAAGAGGPGGAQGGIRIVSGNGQVVREWMVTTEPMVVEVRDSAGNPIPAARVDFTISQGQGTLTPGPIGSASATGGTTLTMLTDANGQASALMLASLVSPGYSWAQTTVTATSQGSAVNFIVTTTIATLQGGGQAPYPSVVLVRPPEEDRRLEGKAGQTASGAIVVRVFASGGPQVGQPIPGVGVRITTNLDPALGPTASCDGGTVLTDGTGTATCDVIFGPKIGLAELQVLTGSFNTKTIQLTVVPGPPAQLKIVQGNNQSGNPGQTLPLALVAEVQDAGGNILEGVPVAWEVVTAGSATLSNVVARSSYNGRVSALVTLGSIPGTHQIRVRTVEGNVMATFTVTVNVALARLNKVSGDNQTAATNQAFPAPLVVQALDDRGQPIAGLQVSFAVASGSATLSATTATTNAQGQASVNVTAGATAGSITIQVTAGSLSVTFTLSSRLPGPVLGTGSFVNAAGGQTGVVAGSIVTIRGSGLAPRVQGCVEPGTIIGPLPTTLAGVTVTFGSHLAPIFHVCNVGGVEQVTVQAPWELGPGVVPVKVTVDGGETLVNDVRVLYAQPGIFETVDAAGRRYAVVVRPNGTFVTPTNPARRGEILRMYATGLGPVLPVTQTNQPGMGQAVYLPVIVGVANAGVRVVSAEYAQNMIGVYVVSFEVPADTRTGTEIPLDLVVQLPDGSKAQAPGSRIAIQ